MAPDSSSKDEQRSLFLVIPGLFGPRTLTPSEIPSLPILETILRRSDVWKKDIPGNFESTLFYLFGTPIEPDKDIPVAAVSRVLDMGAVDTDWWIRADPVHLRMDQDKLYLFDSQVLKIEQDEADSLIKDIMEVFAENGWVLQATTPDRWYLKLPTPPVIQTAPLADVIGCDIAPFLPRGEEGKDWHALLNEIQILLHTSTVNIERENRGEMVINSLWFWGGGKLPKVERSRWAEVWSNEVISLALTRLSVTPCSALPASAGEWLKQAVTPGDHLVILDQARGSVQYNDTDDWQNYITALEADWLDPIMAAIRAGEVQRLGIITDAGQSYVYQRKCGRRWWRRHRPLTYYRKKLNATLFPD